MRKMLFKRMMLTIIIGFPAIVPFILLFTGMLNQMTLPFTSSLLVAYPALFVLFWLLDYSVWLRRICLLITTALGALSLLQYLILAFSLQEVPVILSRMLKPAALSLYIVLILVYYIGFRLYKASTALMPQPNK
jgi:hypothetical protein